MEFRSSHWLSERVVVNNNGEEIDKVSDLILDRGINPTLETKYWRDAYPTRPYAGTGSSYDDYEPAYRYGWESFSRRGGQARTFESIEAELAGGWDQAKGKSSLAWDKARQASRDAWDRVQRAVREPGRRTEG